MTKIVARSSWLGRIDRMRLAADALRNIAASVRQKKEVETRLEPATRLNNRISKRGPSRPRLRCADRTRPVSRQTVLDIELQNTAAKRFGIRKKNRFDAGAHTSGPQNQRGAREGGVGICRQARLWELESAPPGIEPAPAFQSSLHQRGA